MNTKQNNQAIALQLENTQNMFEAITASTMMVVMKRRKKNTSMSSPASPSNW